MATSTDEKHRFKSNYALDTYITAAQYLAEFMCERLSEKEGKKLPFRFWQTPQWKQVFQLQILKANEWVKEYDVGIVLKVLRSPRGLKIYSLGAKAMLKPLLEQEKNKLVGEVNIVEEADINQKPRQIPAGKKSLLGSLD